MLRLASLVLLVLFGCLQSQAACASPKIDDAEISYTLDLGSSPNRYVNITLAFKPTGDTSELMMAVWTPGSYLVREYARHMDSLEVIDENGDPLSIRKTRKNRWVIENESAEEVKVSYRLYCNEKSVRTNFVNREYAVLNGAPTFLTHVDRLEKPHLVRLKLPTHWKRSATSMENTNPHEYLAANFDELVDSPIVAGNIQLYPFEAGGVEHQLVNVGEEGLWNGVQAAADLKRMVESHQEMWGSVPYKRYLFLNVLSGGGGGLEHDNSTLVLSSIWTYRDRSRYQRWLSLCSHEFFHTWNVRRLRPKPLVKYDYENEVYTDGLWIAEGITSYYQDLALVRCGLISKSDFMSSLNGDISDVQRTWGRKVQSLRDSSFDTWIKFYRPDENSGFTRISYYSKGAVAAFLLDMKIRKLTRNKKSLDDVMRRMFEDFSETGFTSEDFRKTASDVTGKNLSKWFTRAIDSTQELDFDNSLEYMGIDPPQAASKSDKDADAKDDSKEDKIKERSRYSSGSKTIGARISGNTVSNVVPDSQAWQLGLLPGDEILAINGLRLSGSFDQRIRQYHVGDQIELLLSRENRMFSETVTLEKRKTEDWSIRWATDSSTKTDSRVRSWLNLPEPEPDDSDAKEPEANQKKKKRRKKKRTSKQ